METRKPEERAWMMVNRWLLIISLIGIVFTAACNNQSILDKHDDIQVPLQEKQEIVVWHTYSEEETRIFENEIIPLFEKEYPMIDVKPVRQSYTKQLKSALVARASAKEPPDVVRMDIVWLPYFNKLGLLYPISDFAGFDQIKSALLNGPLQSNYFNGKYYGLPLDTNTKIAIYNKELLQRAGYTKPPNTMDQVLDIVVNHNAAISMAGLNAWESLPYFYAFGGKLLDRTYTKATGYLNNQESIHAVEKLLKLYKNSTSTKGRLTINTDRWNGIINGDSLMIDEGPWFYSIQSPEKVKKIVNTTVAAPFPITNGQGSVLGGENLVIMKGSQHPSAAWQFVKWMVSKEPQELMLKAGLIPTSKDIDFKKFIRDYPYYQAYIDGINNAFLRPPVAKWDEIEQVYTNYFRLMFSGHIGVAEGLTAAAKEIDQLLAEDERR